MTGLFSKTPKDLIRKENLEKKKNIRKLIKKKKYEKALEIGETYLKKIPYDDDILFIIGSIYYLKKKYKTALSYFDRVLEIGTYDVDALLLKANSHYFLGEKKRAKECCAKILEVDEQNKGIKELVEKLNL